jgi:hypothetical protein
MVGMGGLARGYVGKIMCGSARMIFGYDGGPILAGRLLCIVYTE